MILLFMAATAASPTAECTEERASVEAVADTFKQRYVLEERGRQIAQSIRTQVSTGAFDQHCSDGKAFAEFMTRELRRISSDRHVRLEYTIGASDAKEDNWIEKWYAEAPGKAYGVAGVERFEGNIGYLNLTDFYEYDPAEGALTAAFTLLSTSSAMILDLRHNSGGTDETARPVEWSFRAAGSPIAFQIESRVNAPVKIAEPDFNWQRYGTDRPLVILTSQRTASAAEAVAYNLQAEGRAVVIGETSRGAAHLLGEPAGVGHGWQVWMPEARPVNAHTGGNWERSGIVPDIVIDADQALARARLYLQTILAAKPSE